MTDRNAPIEAPTIVQDWLSDIRVVVVVLTPGLVDGLVDISVVLFVVSAGRSLDPFGNAAVVVASVTDALGLVCQESI